MSPCSRALYTPRLGCTLDMAAASLSPLGFRQEFHPRLTHCSRVTEDSILAVQVFDQRKFKKKDQGFLGVINVRIGDVLELGLEADGTSRPRGTRFA